MIFKWTVEYWPGLLSKINFCSLKQLSPTYEYKCTKDVKYHKGFPFVHHSHSYLHNTGLNNREYFLYCYAYSSHSTPESRIWMVLPSIIEISLKILNIFTITCYLQNPRATFQKLWFAPTWFGSQNVSISGFSNSELWCRKIYLKKSFKLSAEESPVASSKLQHALFYFFRHQDSSPAGIQTFCVCQKTQRIN